MEPCQNAPPAFPANDSNRPAALMPQGIEKRKSEMNDETEIQTVPAVLAEVQAQRYAKLVRWLILGWAVSAVALLAVIAWTL